MQLVESAHSTGDQHRLGARHRTCRGLRHAQAVAHDSDQHSGHGALHVIQMVNSQMVSAFCRGQGVTGERWHSRWPDAPADAIFHHQGRLSSHLLPVAFHRM